MSVSNGDYDGLGKTREEELKKSCALLKMCCRTLDPPPTDHFLGCLPCSTLLYCARLCSTLLYSARLCSALLYSAARLCSTVLDSAHREPACCAA